MLTVLHVINHQTKTATIELEKRKSVEFSSPFVTRRTQLLYSLAVIDMLCVRSCCSSSSSELSIKRIKWKAGFFPDNNRRMCNPSWIIIQHSEGQSHHFTTILRVYNNNNNNTTRQKQQFFSLYYTRCCRGGNLLVPLHQ